MKKIYFRYKGKKFDIEAEACDLFDKVVGLMFKSRENANALLFEFKKSTDMGIHSFFVFFPFMAIWLDKKGKVLEIRKIMPFTFSAYSKKKYNKLIEIPFNKKYDDKIKLFYP